LIASPIEVVLAADRVLRVEHFGRRAQVRVVLERRLDPRLVAHQQELEAVVAAPRDRRALDHHPHAFIAAHRVDGDTRKTHGWIVRSSAGLKPDRDDLAPVVVAASRAQVVRALELATIRALVEGLDLQGIVAAAHAPA
jgi:hypothetical protein